MLFAVADTQKCLGHRKRCEVAEENMLGAQVLNRETKIEIQCVPFTVQDHHQLTGQNKHLSTLQG